MADERDTNELLNDPTPEARNALVQRTLERVRILVRCLKRRRGVSDLVDTDAVVDDGWVRVLLLPDPPAWANRANFFGYMAVVMSSVLIDHLRARRLGEPLEAAATAADKREPTPEEQAACNELAAAIAAQLQEFARDYPTEARVLELDQEGLEVKEIAREVGLAPAQVYRARAKARQHLDTVLGRAGFGCGGRPRMDAHEILRQAEALYLRHGNTLNDARWEELVQKEAPCPEVAEQARRLRREVDAQLNRMDELEGEAQREALGELEAADPPVFRGVQRLLGNPQAAGGQPPLEDPGPPCLPRYEILGTLGKGGMGVVYKARDVELNRLVALKVIRDPALAGTAGLARFRQEARAAAQLSHAGVVQVYELDMWQGRPFLVLELVEGGSLASKLTDRPVLPR